MNTCGTHLKNNNNYSTCRNTNWMYISRTWWWFLAPYAGASNNVWSVGADGYLNFTSAGNSRGVRPAVYLTSSLSLSGSGTQSDPYRIG